MTKAPPRRLRLLAVGMGVLTAMYAGLLAPTQSSVATPAYADISGAGSTWSANAINQWVSDVHQFHVTVHYSGVGSTTGRQEFGQGSVEFGASEIPYGVHDGANTDNPPNRGFAYMPDTAGGTTFMYNLHSGGSQITDLRLSGAVIAGIFTNKITMWNDPKIAADNPGLTLPAERIIPVVRSDGSGSSALFTQWMIATQPSYWTAYCAVMSMNPCTQTSAYPIQPGTNMVGQQGDANIAGYVAQAQAEGAIGYVEFSYAINTGFPVAKVLNAAGYYTEPTPGHVAVSLLKAQINQDKSNPNVYLTQDLSQVYTDTDPRTYELSGYSYMILPTDTSLPLSTEQGYTLGVFGSYLLCQGQTQVDVLGYSALPINLVEAGYAQLQRIPGNTVPTATADFIQNCKNPTFSPDGTNKLANTDPNPPACDKQGATMCTSATGGAPGSGGSNGNNGNGGNSGANGTGGKGGNSGANGNPGNSGSNGNGTNGNGGSHTGGPSSPGSTKGGNNPSSTGNSQGSSGGPTCDPNTGVCTSGNAGSNTAGTGTTGTVNGVPVAAPTGFGNALQVALMALAAALLLGLGLVPPLVGHASTRRRQRRGGGPFAGPEERR